MIAMTPKTASEAEPQTAKIRILCVSGSVRSGSYNRKLLATAAEVAPPDAELELWQGLKDLPPFDEDDEDDPGPDVFAFRDAIRQAHGVLIATPQYNASIPGQLKNGFDWASRPYVTNVLRGKPVAVIGASAGPSGAVRSQAEARTVLSAIGAEVLSAELAIRRVADVFDGNGRLAAPDQVAHLKEVVEQLVDRARQKRFSATQGAKSKVPTLM